MKTRLWLNIALVIVIAILVAFVYFKPGTKKPAPPVLLTTLKANDITSIKIAQDNGASVELVRKSGSWQMLAPAKLPADQHLVKTLLDGIHAEVKSSFPVKTADLSRYSLDPPQLRLWLNGTEFDFGTTEPINHYRYVKIGNTIRLADGLLFYRINHRPLWWASKRLLPENAHIIGLQLPDVTLTLKGAKWQLAPANPAISADAIQQLVNNWSEAQAISTVKLSQGKPEGEVAIELAGNSQPLRFAILKDPDFPVLARPDLGLQYELDSSQRDALLTLKSASTSPKPATVVKPAAAHKEPAHGHL